MLQAAEPQPRARGKLVKIMLQAAEPQPRAVPWPSWPWIGTGRMPVSGVCTFSKCTIQESLPSVAAATEGGPQPALSPAGAGRVRGSRLDALPGTPSCQDLRHGPYPAQHFLHPPLRRFQNDAASPLPLARFRWGRRALDRVALRGAPTTESCGGEVRISSYLRYSRLRPPHPSRPG